MFETVKVKRLILDIETTLDHKHIFIAATKDIDTQETITWNQADNLQDYLRDATLIIGHNLISFDAYLLKKLWKIQMNSKIFYDTLIVSRLLDPSREGGHSLAALGEMLKIQKIDYKAVWQWMSHRAEEYPGECFNKPLLPLLKHYCIRDLEVTEQLYHYLTKELSDKKFSDDCVLLEHQVADIISQQERNGFRLDLPYATCLLADIQGKLDEISQQMQDRWPPYTVERISEKTGKLLKPQTVAFNPGSRQQIGQKLIELGWKPKKFTETGQPMVDEGVLASVDIPEAQIIATYLMLQKRIAQVSSWMEAIGDDGRVHGRVITNGAVTGRMTHRNPNMAQIPNSGSIYGHECRECWIAGEGNVLVGCDASGLELRMLAHYMKDEDYVRTVCEGSSKNGTDVHTVNQKAAGLATRDSAKTFIYAYLYGAGDAKIGSIVGGSAKDGAELKAKFLEQTPALRVLLSTVAKLSSKGYVPGLDGRRILVRSEHAALNTLLQGSGAIVMKKALVIFNEKVLENKWPVKLVANVHDELQMETTPDIADTVGKACVESIREAGVFYNLRCPLDGEYKIGNSWKQTH